MLEVICVFLLFAEPYNFLCNSVNIFLGQQFTGFLDYQILNICFADSLFMAGLVPAVGHTLVVVIFGSSFAGSANACHSSLTIPAE